MRPYASRNADNTGHSLGGAASLAGAASPGTSSRAMCSAALSLSPSHSLALSLSLYCHPAHSLSYGLSVSLLGWRPALVASRSPGTAPAAGAVTGAVGAPQALVPGQPLGAVRDNVRGTPHAIRPSSLPNDKKTLLSILVVVNLVVVIGQRKGTLKSHHRCFYIYINRAWIRAHNQF